MGTVLAPAHPRQVQTLAHHPRAGTLPLVAPPMSFDRLGGDRGGQDAERELVGPAAVGVGGAGAVGGQHVDCGLDRLVAGSGEVFDLGLLLGRPRCGGQGRTALPGSGSPRRSLISLLCTKIPLTFKTPTAL